MNSRRSCCLLRWQAGVDVLVGVTCPDIPIEVRDTASTFRCRHIAVERGWIGFNTNTIQVEHSTSTP